MPLVLRTVFIVGLVAATSLWAAGPAHAQRSRSEWRRVAAARTLGIEAVKLFNAGKYAAALDKFERAYQLHAVPTIAVKLADCMERTGRLVDAAEVYREATRYKLRRGDSWLFPRAQKAAKKKRAALLPRIPQLTIELDGPLGSGTEVRLNGRAVPSALLGAAQPVDPGELTLEARRTEGDVELKKTVTIGEGAKKTVRFKLPAIAEERSIDDEPTDHLRPVWISSFALAGVGVLTTIINGSIALNHNATLKETCPNRNCPPSEYDRLDVYDATRIATTVGMVLAGAGAAVGGLTLWLSKESLEDGDKEARGQHHRRHGKNKRSWRRAHVRITPTAILFRAEF